MYAHEIVEHRMQRDRRGTLPFVLSPLPVPKEGFIKVRAVCGDVTTNLGSLMLRSLRPEEKIPGLNA